MYVLLCNLIFTHLMWFSQSAERWSSLGEDAGLQNFELHSFRAAFQMVNIKSGFVCGFSAIVSNKATTYSLFEGSFKTLSRGFSDKSFYWAPREGLPSSEAKKSS